jgi:DNA primase
MTFEELKDIYSKYFTLGYVNASNNRSNIENRFVLISLIDYVSAEFLNDKLSFSDPLYQQIWLDAVKHCHDEGFKASTFFMSSPDLEISRMASDLMSDKYQLSKGQQMADEESLVGSYINRLLLDYKYHILNEQIQSIVKQMSLPEVVNDIAKSTILGQQFVSLTAVSRDMAKQLGDRVIQK